MNKDCMMVSEVKRFEHAVRSVSMAAAITSSNIFNAATTALSARSRRVVYATSQLLLLAESYTRFILKILRKNVNAPSEKCIH
ncbi:MAG: hypothetical protein ACSLEM_03770 [Candidatus Malihini olakiniferum]